ncbi:DUF4468 domain-containing protein [Spirosoma sp. KNUC1025]|uniref:DUF4468 domain-containing protein n=1 Tax=Spirosoma sp. KNUC1025 TaxID=2894082 RepID=UPI0038679DFE|nr:DUF4468 domain-containing protein [Spirosoma sp. KNUC1025]
MNQRLFLIGFLALVLLSLFYLHKKRYTLADMPYSIDSTTGGIVCQNTAKVQGVDQEQLYNRAKHFLIRNFVKGNAAIQIDDKNNGVLVGKGIIRGLMSVKTAGMDYEAPIEIRVKGDSYQYKISDMAVVNTDNGGRYDINQDIHEARENAIRQGKKAPTNIEMSQRQYEEHMMKLKPFTDLAAQLRDAMQKPNEKESL